MNIPARFVDAEQALHQAAMKATGLSDFGSPEYSCGLRILLRSLDDDLKRDPSQREACFGAALVPLVARLHAQEGWKHDPGCLKIRIRRPIFIVGAPRTGTTALHKLLSVDPCFQGLNSWLIRTPMTRPPRNTWDVHPAYRRALDAHRIKMERAPELKFIHFVEPHEVDECMGVTTQTFISNLFGSVAHVPSYDAWFRAQDFRPAYRRLADNLRLIGAAAPGTAWLLKNPSHLLNLEELLDVFDDALVIHTHRDPLKSIPSTCSLLSIHHRTHDGAAMDLRTIGIRESSQWSDALLRGIALARRHPKRILEVLEEEIADAPRALVRRIYDFAGLELSSEASGRMDAWLAGNRKGQHGAHRYSAEDFGLCPDGLRATFAEYREHYGFAREDVKATARSPSVSDRQGRAAVPI